VEAVRGVDLQVEDGEIVGFPEPNGAGKLVPRA
jgi:ABC-type lipopolysaccharide export system ATPase subunit